MKKITKPLLYKIAGITGIVSLPVVATLGVVYGTKEEEYNSGQKPAVTFGERFFDENMAEGSATFSSRTLLSPFRPLRGGGNLSHLIRLDRNFDTPSAHKILATDETGAEKRSLRTTIIRTSNILSQEGLDNAFRLANKQLAETVAANPDKNLGVYIGKDMRRREITASLYEIKSVEAEDKAMLDEFLTDLGDFGVPGVNSDGSINPNMFYQVFGSENTLTPDQIHYYNFTPKGAAPETAEQQKTRETALWTKWGLLRVQNQVQWANTYINDPSLKEEDKKFQLIDGQEDELENEGHMLVKKFVDKNLVVTYKPSIDWEKRELKVTIFLYKLDKNSIYRLSLGDQVDNAVGVHSIVRHIPLSKLVAPKPSAALAPADRTAAIATVKDFLGNQIPRYVKNRIVGTGFPIISMLIESLSASLDHILKIGNALAYDIGKPPAGLSANDVNNPLSPKYEFIPNSPNQAWHNLINQKNVLDNDAFVGQMVDKLYTDPSIDFKALLDLMSNFENQAFNSAEHYWTDISKMQQMYANDGGQYKIYQLTSLFNSVGDMLYNKMKEEHKLLEAVRDRSLVDKLIKYLRQNKVVSDTYALNDLLANPVLELIKILKTISDKHIALPEALIKEAIPLVPIQIIADHADGVAKAIVYLTTGNNLSTFMGLLGKTDAEQKQMIKDLTSADTRWEAIEKLVSNTDVTRAQIQVLFRALKMTGIVPASLNALIGDTDAAADTYVRLFKNGGAKAIFKLVKTLFEKGIANMADNDVVTGVTASGGTLSAADKKAIETWLFDPANASVKDNIMKSILKFDADYITYKRDDSYSADPTKYSFKVYYVNGSTSTEITGTTLEIDKALFASSSQNFSTTMIFDSNAKPAFKAIAKKVRDAIVAGTKITDSEFMFQSVSQNPDPAHNVVDASGNVTEYAFTINYYDPAHTYANGSHIVEIPAASFTIPAEDLLTDVKTVLSAMTPEITALREKAKEAAERQIIKAQITAMDFATFERMQSIIPPKNEFVDLLNDAIKKIGEVVQFGGIDNLQGFISGFAAPLVYTINNLVTHPLADTGLYSLLGQFNAQPHNIGGWGNQALLNGIPTLLGTMAHIKMFEHVQQNDLSKVSLFLGKMINEGIVPGLGAFASHGLQAPGGLDMFMNSLFALIAPSGNVIGKAGDAPEKVWTSQEITSLTHGLLFGFGSADNMINTLKGILPSMFAKKLPVGMQSLEYVLRDIYNNAHVPGSAFLFSIDTEVKPELKTGLQKILRSGLASLTEAEMKSTFLGLRATLTGGIVSMASSLVPGLDAIISKFNKALPTDASAEALGESLYAIIHNPLRKLDGEHVDNVVKIINAFGLLKREIPLFGDALHHLLDGGIKTMDAAELDQLLSVFNLSSGLKEIVVKAFYGTNYKATYLTTVKDRVAHLPVVAEVAIETGAEVPSTVPTFKHEKDRYDSALAAFNIAAVPATPLQEILTAYHNVLDAKKSMEKVNTAVSAANTKLADTKAIIAAITHPSETHLNDPTQTSQLGGRTWAAIQTKWDALVNTALTGKSQAALEKIISDLNNLLIEFKVFNEDVAKLNAGQVLIMTPEAIRSILRKASTSNTFKPSAILLTQLKESGVKVYADHADIPAYSRSLLAERHAQLSGTPIAGKDEISFDEIIKAASKFYGQPKIDITTLMFAS